VGVFLLSFIFDLGGLLANIPALTIFGLQLHRLLLSPLVCVSVMSVLFVGMTFTSLGRSMEAKLGTVRLLLLMGTFSLVVNLTFTSLCLLLFFGTKNPSTLAYSAQGFWMILMALLTIDCHSPGSPPTRRLMFLPFQIPTIYYPAALLAFFTYVSPTPFLSPAPLTPPLNTLASLARSLFMGIRIDMYVSTACGYAYVHGFLDRLKFDDATVLSLETNAFRNLSTRPGFILLVNAGGEDFLPVAASAPSSASSSSTRAAPPPGGWGASSASTISSLPAPGTVAPPAFSGSGRKIGSFGGGSSRPADSEDPAAARAAMAAAAERRAANAGN
jgi:hypothetical protein